MDQWKRAEAKAKAEQERNRDLEAKFQDFVESLGKNLTSTVDELENTSMVNSVCQILTVKVCSVLLLRNEII
jgi:hypothetical protein